MTVEQLLKALQKLIARGTINSNADIEILGDVYADNGIWDFESADLEIGVHESSYNKLILFTTANLL